MSCFFLVVLYHVYVVGNSIRSLVTYPHCHIRILPITSTNISAVFLLILPLRRSAHPQIRTSAFYRSPHIATSYPRDFKDVPNSVPAVCPSPIILVHVSNTILHHSSILPLPAISLNLQSTTQYKQKRNIQFNSTIPTPKNKQVMSQVVTYIAVPGMVPGTSGFLFCDPTEIMDAGSPAHRVEYLCVCAAVPLVNCFSPRCRKGL